MRLLQFNILYGCRTDERLERFKRWMKQHHDYDVVGFNEMNDWTNEALRHEALDWGYPYSFLFETKTSPFYIGVISKSPIDIIECDETSFHHGLVHAKIKGIHFFLTHLTPFDSVFREKEAEKIASLVTPIKEKVVVMGDLNTLSPLDDTYYQAIHAERYFASTDTSSLQLRDGKINYRPMQILLDAGLFDSGYQKSFDFSLPTAIKSSSKATIKRRLDYILVNDAMRPFNPITRIIHDPEVDHLSDHYPVECLFDDK